MSNTYPLEKLYDWNGILVENVQCWHEGLLKNKGFIIVSGSVNSTSGRFIDFIVAKHPELLTIFGFEGLDKHANALEKREKVTVQTVSLTDLLQDYFTPEQIDHLSVDTEGSGNDIF